MSSIANNVALMVLSLTTAGTALWIVQYPVLYVNALRNKDKIKILIYYSPRSNKIGSVMASYYRSSLGITVCVRECVCKCCYQCI